MDWFTWKVWSQSRLLTGRTLTTLPDLTHHKWSLYSYRMLIASYSIILLSDIQAAQYMSQYWHGVYNNNCMIKLKPFRDNYVKLYTPLHHTDQKQWRPLPCSKLFSIHQMALNNNYRCQIIVIANDFIIANNFIITTKVGNTKFNT